MNGRPHPYQGYDAGPPGPSAYDANRGRGPGSAPPLRQQAPQQYHEEYYGNGMLPPHNDAFSAGVNAAPYSAHEHYQGGPARRGVRGDHAPSPYARPSRAPPAAQAAYPSQYEYSGPPPLHGNSVGRPPTEPRGRGSQQWSSGLPPPDARSSDYRYAAEQNSSYGSGPPSYGSASAPQQYSAPGSSSHGPSQAPWPPQSYENQSQHRPPNDSQYGHRAPVPQSSGHPYSKVYPGGPSYGPGSRSESAHDSRPAPPTRAPGYASGSAGPGRSTGPVMPVELEAGKVHDGFQVKPMPCRIVVLRNLSPSTDPNSLHAEAAQIGELKNFDTQTPGTVALNYFDIRASEKAFNAFNGRELDGHILAAFYSIPRGEHLSKLSSGEQDQGTIFCFITGPRVTVPDSAFHEVFSAFGEVWEIRSYKDQGNARFVEFFDSRAGSFARASLSGQLFRDGPGKWDIKFAWDLNSKSRNVHTNYPSQAKKLDFGPSPQPPAYGGGGPGSYQHPPPPAPFPTAASPQQPPAWVRPADPRIANAGLHSTAPYGNNIQTNPYSSATVRPPATAKPPATDQISQAKVQELLASLQSLKNSQAQPPVSSDPRTQAQAPTPAGNTAPTVASTNTNSLPPNLMQMLAAATGSASGAISSSIPPSSQGLGQQPQGQAQSQVGAPSMTQVQQVLAMLAQQNSGGARTS